LLAISISSEIERKFSISFGLRDFYNSPSIFGISECISNKLQNQPKIETDLGPITNYNTDDNSIISSIIEIWKEYMGVPDIKPVDNFFDLGGHSLLAISISSEIERKFSISFGLRDFYNSPTVIGISESISSKLQNQPE
jgi:acyl carrier protein